MELSNPLPSRAARLQQRADEERRTGVEWTTTFSRLTRARLNDVFLTAVGDVFAQNQFDDIVKQLLEQHSEFEGTFLGFSYAMKRHMPDAWMPDLLDAAAVALADFAAASEREGEPWGPEATINMDRVLDSANDVLLENRVAFGYTEGRLRARAAQPLHLSLVQPFEHALTGDPVFGSAEAAYLQASAELATGHYGASITSAGSVLQSTLLALGARGNDIGALFSDATKRRFLSGHDSNLLAALKSLGGWITADRSNRGNAHGPATAQREDAELALHIATAVSLRLMRSAAREVAPEGLG